MATLQVDRAQSNAMNLQVLRRQDEHVMDIVDMASHVVIYEFDQTQQNWKRKEVEGCLFVVKRYTAPRFQIFVNNRLSTTNMVVPVDDTLEVDNIDSFLILRCPDEASANGFAIYGVWFFPEDDREKILKLLTRMIQSMKDPQSAPAASPPAPPPSASSTSSQKQQKTKQPTPQPQQQQKPQARGRKDQQQQQQRTQSAGAATTPTMILQRQKDAQQPPMSTHMPLKPISKAEGIAAGEAILGMISHQRRPSNETDDQSQPLLVPSSVASTTRPSSAVNKEQLKQTIIGLLDDPAFFDQIYHAYVDRMQRHR